MLDEYEDGYLAALMRLNEDGITETRWLTLHFNLYKSTLNWPDDLPPIPRSNLYPGLLRTKFHETYKAILAEHPHQLENAGKSLRFLLF